MASPNLGGGSSSEAGILACRQHGSLQLKRHPEDDRAFSENVMVLGSCTMSVPEPSLYSSGLRLMSGAAEGGGGEKLQQSVGMAKNGARFKSTTS